MNKPSLSHYLIAMQGFSFSQTAYQMYAFMRSYFQFGIKKIVVEFETVWIES